MQRYSVYDQRAVWIWIYNMLRYEEFLYGQFAVSECAMRKFYILMDFIF